MNRTLAISLLLFSRLLAAADSPVVGQKAPDFELTSLAGTQVKLSQAVAKGPVVLVVLRGFPGYQCPYCNRQVQDLVKNAEAFGGARVLLVYPGPAADVPDHAKEFAADKHLPANFDLLLDPDYQFTNLYNLRWDAPKETAYPSTYIVDAAGVITFAKTSRAHGNRTTAAELAAELQKSSKK